MDEQNFSRLKRYNEEKNQECRERYVGLIRENKKGCKYKIINYIDANNVDVFFFNTGKIVKRQLRKSLNGNIKDPYEPCVEGMGWIGEGKHRVKINGILNKRYEAWRGILKRCNPKFWSKLPTYIGCQICEEWKCFQTFADWYDLNYYQIDNDIMEIDKDILYKSKTKKYSPNNCIFVNHKINCLFTKRENDRGEFPIGVYKLIKDNNIVYASCCSYVDKQNSVKHKNLGYFNTPEEAFYAYKKFKENYIKQVADEYKDKIPQKLYDAMYRYEVEITD